MKKVYLTTMLWLLAVLLSVDLQAVAAAKEPVEPCTLWGHAGAQMIFKCVDEDPPYAVCYVPVAGVMQCLMD